MKRWLTLFACAAGFAVIPSVSLAQSNTMGIALQWDNCAGGTGASSSKNFACASNTGTNLMYCSFVPPGGMTPVVAASGVLDVHTDQSALPPWWDITPLSGGTHCRAATSLTASFDFTAGPFDCVDFWAGQASGGATTDYLQIGGDATRVRMNWVCAVAAGVAPDSTQHYYSVRIGVNNAKTTGAGNCAGCNFGACIRLNDTRLSQQPSAGGDIYMTAPPPGVPGAVQQIYWNTDPGAPTCTFTATRAQTWGQIKSLYR